MCTAALALAGIGAAANLYQGVAQSKAEKAYGNAQASALEQNADIAEAQGHDAIQRAGLEELRLRRGLAQQMGNINAQAGASGIDTNSGSVQDVRNATISEGEQDAAAIRFNAARERWGYNAQAANLRTQANMTRAISKANARNILTGSVLGFGVDTATAIYEGNQRTSALTKQTDSDWVDTFGIENKRRNGRKGT